MTTACLAWGRCTPVTGPVPGQPGGVGLVPCVAGLPQLTRPVVQRLIAARLVPHLEVNTLVRSPRRRGRAVPVTP